MSLLFEKNSGKTVHIMDESGIFTNMLPKKTYVHPEEKEAFVVSSEDTTKDTVVATLSSNGNGDLFYVPFRAATKELHDTYQKQNRSFLF